MSLFELIILSLALSVDCFTVCLIFGMQRNAFKRALREGEKDPFPPLGHEAVKAGCVFAVFHIVMILLGWFLGLGMMDIVSHFDHWVAFALLAGIGLKSVIEAFNTKENDIKAHAMFDFKSLMLLGLATSIDAFAVGISLKMLDVSLIRICTSVPVAVFICTVAACLLGYFLFSQMKKISPKLLNIIGGIVLIGIGVRILLEHLAA